MEIQESPALTLQNLEAALQCLTLGAADLKQAESALLSWQKHQVNDYTSALLCATLCPHVRLAALLLLKAVVKQSWKDRGRAQRQLLDEATKQQVRGVLLAFVTTGDHPFVHQDTIDQQYRSQFNTEPVIQDRTVQAAATSCLVQIALFDLPKQSQDLIPLLVSHIMTKQQTTLQRRNSLCALEAILEDLSQKRLLGMKQHVQVVATNHVATLIQEASGLVSLCLSNPSSLDTTLSEMCLSFIRVIHYLLEKSLSTIVNERQINAASSVDHWMQLILDYSAAFLSKKEVRTPNQLALQLCESMWELIVDIQEAYPIDFGRYLQPFLNLYYSVLFTGFDETSTTGDCQGLLKYYEKQISQPFSVDESLTILALRFLANTVSCSHYIPDETGRARTNITSKGDVALNTSDVQHAVNVVWSSFFSRERICNLADICTCRLMRIQPEAIEEWAADPEGYFISEEHRTALESVSLAAQMLFCSLVESPISKLVVLGRLTSLLGVFDSQMNSCRHEIAPVSYASGGSSPGDVNPSVLLWECLFTALGLSTSMLEDFKDWDFQTWYREALQPCLGLLLSNNAGAQLIPLLRRRTVWLIGCTSSQLPANSEAFKSMVEVLAADTSKHNDIAVKLSAVQAISIMASNFDEAMEEGVPYAAFIVNALYRLANECEELESQSSVLDTIPVILTYIIGTGRDITPEVATGAIAPLPSVWDNCCLARVPLRRNVILILTVVVASTGPAEAERLLHIALPIIASSVDPRSSADHSFLVGDALLLWLSILRNSGTYNSTIGEMFQLVVRLVEVDFEHLRLLMMIAEMYVMIGGNAFLYTNADALSRLLHLTVGQVRQRGAKYIGLVLEALLREYPSGGGLFLLRNGVLSTMLHSCALNYFDDEQRESDGVLTVYLNSLARILIASPGILDDTLPFGNDSAAGGSFSYLELLRIYLKLLNEHTGTFSQCLWMKFLLTFFPLPQAATPQNRLSEAFANVIDAFLLRCVKVLPGLLSGHKHIPEYYQPEYASDEETIDTGQERYEAMLKYSQSKDTLSRVRLKDMVTEKLAYVCKSDDATCQALRNGMNPQVLATLNEALHLQ